MAMKFLALVFFAGIALAAAIPLSFHENAVEYPVEEFEEFVFEADDDVKTELGKKLKEQLDQILEKIKETIESGKGFREDYIEKAKEIREKLKDLKVDLGDRAKELIEKLKEKAKDYWQKILDKLKPQESTAFTDDDDIQTEIGKMKESLDEMLEKVMKTIIRGTFDKDTRKKLFEIFEELEDLKIYLLYNNPIDVDQLKQKVEKLFGKGSNFADKLINALKEKGNRSDRALGDIETSDDVKTELGKKLKEQLDQILEKIKETIESGKGFREDYIEKAKEIRQKLKDLKVDLGDRAKELIEKLKEKAKDYWQKILDKLKPQESTAYEEYIKIETGNLKEYLDETLENINKAIKSGFIVKEEILEKLFKVREELKDLKAYLDSNVIDVDQLKEKVETLFGKGSKLADKLITALKERGQRIYRSLGEKETRSVKEVYDRIKNYFKDLNIELKERFVKFGEWVKEQYGKGLEKGKTRLENIREIAFKFIDDSRDGVRNVAEEALVFLRPYKEDLGELYDQVKEKVRDLLKREREERSIKEVYEKIKNYFKDLQIELKEKFVKFGEWAKEQYEKGLEKGKTKAENIRKIADEFIKDSKRVSKEVAEEALEFFRDYKEDLGRVFDDIKEKVKEVVNKEN